MTCWDRQCILILDLNRFLGASTQSDLHIAEADDVDIPSSVKWHCMSTCIVCSATYHKISVLHVDWEDQTKWQITDRKWPDFSVFKCIIENGRNIQSKGWGKMLSPWPPQLISWLTCPLSKPKQIHMHIPIEDNEWHMFDHIWLFLEWAHRKACCCGKGTFRMLFVDEKQQKKGAQGIPSYAGERATSTSNSNRSIMWTTSFVSSGNTANSRRGKVLTVRAQSFTPSVSSSSGPKAMTWKIYEVILWCSNAQLDWKALPSNPPIPLLC